MLDTIRSRLAVNSPTSMEADYPRAGILVPITRSPEPHIVLTRRSDQLRTHSGQVAFPGGMEENEDESLLHTALRETREEIGLPEEHIEVLGRLSDVLSRYRISVRPFVGIVPADWSYELDRNEIESLFSVPLRFFLEEPPAQLDELEFEQYRLRVPRWLYEGYTIWGLSAIVLMDFLQTAFDRRLGSIEVRNQV